MANAKKVAAPKAAEVKKVETAPVAKAAEVKKAPEAKKPVEAKKAAPAKKAPAAKKAAPAKKVAAKKPAAKKVAKKTAEPKTFAIQSSGNETSYAAIVKKVNKAIKEDVKSLEIYINLDEKMVYYVANKTITGSVELF